MSASMWIRVSALTQGVKTLLYKLLHQRRMRIPALIRVKLIRPIFTWSISSLKVDHTYQIHIFTEKICPLYFSTYIYKRLFQPDQELKMREHHKYICRITLPIPNVSRIQLATTSFTSLPLLVLLISIFFFFTWQRVQVHADAKLIKETSMKVRLKRICRGVFRASEPNSRFE